MHTIPIFKLLNYREKKYIYEILAKTSWCFGGKPD